MRITYVTQDTELWGGISVVFQHLELLAAAGHDVFLTTVTSRPDWYPLKVPVHRITSFDPSVIPAADILVIASWKIARAIIESGKGIPVYLCQGYEASLSELTAHKAEIDGVYRTGIPVLTVSRHLGALLEERFNAETYYIGQMINRKIFYPSRNPLKGFFSYLGGTPRVLVVGPFEGSYKNIPTILRGITLAEKALKKPLKLIRVSQFPLSPGEKAMREPDAYHFYVPYKEMGKIYRNADVIISLSKESEGFGLPPLEAMACGIPAILSKISAHLAYDDPQDFAVFVESRAEALAEAILTVVGNREIQQKLAERGLSVAAKFSGEHVASRLSSAFTDIIVRHRAN